MRSPYTSRVVRIVTPIQPDESSWAAMERAVAMAKAMEAELKGLFLEDTEALAAATLPFTRTVAFQSGRIGAFEAADLQAAYRALAERARQRLAEYCRAQALQWSFEVEARGGEAPEEPAVAGSGAATALEEARERSRIRDLLLLDRRALRFRQQSAALLRLATRHGTVAVADLTGPPPQQVVLIYHGAEDRLILAAQLAHALGVRLEVLVCADDEEGDGSLLADRVTSWMKEHRVAGAVDIIPPAETEAAKARIVGLSGVLVLFERT